MRSTAARSACCLAAAALLAGLAHSAMDVDFGTAIPADDETEIFFAISARYFDEDRRTVERYSSRYRDPDDLAVALFIGSRSSRTPEQIYSLYRQGLSWHEIAVEVDLPPAAWFVEVTREPGPPYGKAYRYWRRHQEDPDQPVVLNDAEIQHLVAARMIHEYYGIPASEAMEWRASGQNLRYLLGAEYRKRHGGALHVADLD